MMFYKETDFKEEPPIGSLPEEWEVVRLKDIVEIDRESKDPSREMPDKTFLYVDIDSIDGGTGKIRNPKRMVGKDAPSRARRVIHENDVIMSTVRPYLKAFAMVPRELDNQICSTGFSVLSCRSNILPYFLLNILFSDQTINQCNRMMVGGQYPALNQSQVSEIKIAIPSLREQRGIVGVLGVVDSAIGLVDRVIAKTERLKKGLMQTLLTRGIGHKEYKQTPIGTTPKTWQMAQLGDYADFRNGINFNKEQRTSQGTLTIDVLNMYGESIYVDFSNLYRVNIPENEECLLKKGDILFVRSSLKREGAGWASLFDGFTEPVTFCSFIIRARLKTNSDVLPEFLTYFLRSDIARRKLIANAGQVAISNITQDSLKALMFPLPPMEEQRKIANIISTFDRKLAFERKEKAKLERIKVGLMDLLLTGKIRVKVD